jgi:hypothetical protein
MRKMNMVLTVNDKQQAMLMHDQPLEFMPSWVEFSRDKRGVRIISEAGDEFVAGELATLTSWEILNGIDGILVVQMQNQKAVVGYTVPFINQDYDSVHQDNNEGED